MKIKKVTKVRERKKKPKYWYQEIPLGVRKVIKVGSSYGVTIPKRFLDSKLINPNDEVIVILLKRTRKVYDEAKHK